LARRGAGSKISLTDSSKQRLEKTWQKTDS
jgi:hypothetical protein